MYTGGSYVPGPGYGTGPGPGYSNVARPGTNDSNYPPYRDSYGDESPRPSYPPVGRSNPVRPDPRDPRGLEPRPDPRASYPVTDPTRMMDIRDQRGESRTIPGYSYPVNSPDVQMGGSDYDYVSAPAPVGRGGGSYAPSRVVQQTGYDPRESPGMRDGYRHEPIREERRSRR